MRQGTLTTSKAWDKERGIDKGRREKRKKEIVKVKFHHTQTPPKREGLENRPMWDNIELWGNQSSTQRSSTNNQEPLRKNIERKQCACRRRGDAKKVSENVVGFGQGSLNKGSIKNSKNKKGVRSKKGTTE